MAPKPSDPQLVLQKIISLAEAGQLDSDIAKSFLDEFVYLFGHELNLYSAPQAADFIKSTPTALPLLSYFLETLSDSTIENPTASAYVPVETLSQLNQNFRQDLSRAPKTTLEKLLSDRTRLLALLAAKNVQRLKEQRKLNQPTPPLATDQLPLTQVDPQQRTVFVDRLVNQLFTAGKFDFDQSSSAAVTADVSHLILSGVANPTPADPTRPAPAPDYTPTALVAALQASLDYNGITYTPRQLEQVKELVTKPAPEVEKTIDSVQRSVTSIQSQLDVLEPVQDSIIVPQYPALLNSQAWKEFHQAAAASLPETYRPFPTKTGAAAAVIAAAYTPDLAQAIVAQSRGVTPEVLNHLITNPTRQMLRFWERHPLFKKQLPQASAEINSGFLREEIAPPRTFSSSQPSTPSAGVPWQRFTNQLASRLPSNLSSVTNAILHPRQALSYFSGLRQGASTVNTLRSLSSATARSFFTGGTRSALLQKGASALMSKMGGSLLAKGVASLAGLASGPVGWALMGLSLAKDIINGIGKFFDKDFDWKKGVLALGSVPLAIMFSATVVSQALALATTIIIAGYLFVYIPIINMAPLMSMLTQLESTAGSLRPALLPPGDLPDSCPSGSPVAGRISQGPGVGTHTIAFSISAGGQTFVSENQAVDYMATTGSPITATHDGQAYFIPFAYSGNSGLGHHVILISTCESHTFATLYGHMLPHIRATGGPVAVTKGQLLGNSGNSGTLGDGPHLHYEIFGLGDIYRYL